jgi:hypothetical protein
MMLEHYAEWCAPPFLMMSLVVLTHTDGTSVQTFCTTSTFTER